MEEIYLPTLLTFANNNVFTGSCGPLRFKLTPTVVKLNPKEVDYDQSSIKGELWHGPLCYEKSDIELERTFPMSEDGRTQLRAWLQENVET